MPASAPTIARSAFRSNVTTHPLSAARVALEAGLGALLVRDGARPRDLPYSVPFAPGRGPVARSPAGRRIPLAWLTQPGGTCSCCGSATWPLPDRRAPLACGLRRNRVWCDLP
jgi:hypothetical protein